MSDIEGEIVCPRKVSIEKLDSPAQQQSQEMYLLPRKCWMKMSNLQIRPSSFEKNQKIRIKISVPNSARVVRSQPIQIDDSMLTYLDKVQNPAGFAEIPIDITAVCEYNHDVRFGHQSNLEIEIEVISSILSRSKTIGSLTIDLANALQCPIKTVLVFQRDHQTTASLRIQLYSLCISRDLPQAKVRANSSVFLSDSDSEQPSQSLPPQTEQNILQILKGDHIILVDTTTPQGQIMRQGLSLSDSVYPVTDPNMIQFVFDVVTKVGVQTPYRMIIAGGDSFICLVLNKFLLMRDRGILSTDTFSFIPVPLSQKGSHISQLAGNVSSKYAEMFLTSQWSQIFLEDSAVQNSSGLITAQIKTIVSCPLITFQHVISDVMLTSTTDQYVVPMLLQLDIGDIGRSIRNPKSNFNTIQMKCTAISEKKNKSVPLRFVLLKAHLESGLLNVSWKNITSTILGTPSPDKLQFEEKHRKGTKIILSIHKGQLPIDLRIDGQLHSNVTGITITIRDIETALNVSTIQP